MTDVVRCVGSGGTQSVDGTMQDPTFGEVSVWAMGSHKTCHVCGQRVRFRVRATDTPPYARVLPHRTDGTPCR